MADQKLILLLVGLKGAGKTKIGLLLEEELRVPFVRVELILLRLRAEQPHISSTEFDEQGVKMILDSVHGLARNSDTVCLEATGTTGYFSTLLDRLRRAFRVLLVRVSAPSEICFRRVMSRDASSHLKYSDDRIREINVLAEKVHLDWDLQIDNAHEWNEQAIIGCIAELLTRVR